ncbi:MAG: phytanoyl-CoA dioxygenase family protein, partial [Planctomycetaceae bacterium]|nr:phytanoyl-CoA dioxygenase family protein [Planctomycetaceae bacterium]
EYEADVNYPGSPDSLEAPGGKTIRRLRQALSRDPVFQDWLSYRPLGTILAQLLGTPVTCPLAHHNCIMTKHPRFSSDTGWHRDTRFWTFQSGELVNAWLALGAETTRNGCLQVIPGSHRMEIGPDRLDADQFLDREHPLNQPLFETVQTVELQAGDLLLFHARTFHAATRNYTDETKYSLVFTFHGPENAPKPGSKSAKCPELILPDLS